MQKGGQTIIYRYNAAGQRIYKKVIGITITEEHYVMNGSELVAVLKNGVVDYWRTSYGRYERSSGTFRAKYYITDHLGSTRVVLDESGQRVEAYDYYAFGLVLPGRGFGNTTKEKFTGKERDSETGWDYFGARYYNPTIARWMNVDPLADKYPSWSPYNYVANNPLSVIDRDGMQWYRVLNADGSYSYHYMESLNADNASEKLKDIKGAEYFGRKGAYKDTNGDVIYLRLGGGYFNITQASLAANKELNALSNYVTTGDNMYGGEAIDKLETTMNSDAVNRYQEMLLEINRPDMFGFSISVSGNTSFFGGGFSLNVGCTDMGCGMWRETSTGAGALSFSSDHGFGFGFGLDYFEGEFSGSGDPHLSTAMGAGDQWSGTFGLSRMPFSFSGGFGHGYNNLSEKQIVWDFKNIGLATPGIKAGPITFSGTYMVTESTMIFEW